MSDTTLSSSSSSCSSTGDGLPARERRWAAVAVLLGIALSNLSTAVVNIALPDMALSLGASDAATVWVVNGYQLAAVVCLLPVAAMVEALGLKRLFASGLAVFTLSSLVCAVAPTLGTLVAARLLQGVGAALLSVAGVALVRVIYPQRLVGKGMAWLAMAVAVPAALGPTFAAMVLAVASWPWIFLINVPLGGVALWLFLRTVPGSERTAHRFDGLGTLLNGLAFGLLVVGVGTLGSGDTRLAVAEILAGLVCFVLLFRQQRRHPSPMLPFDLLRLPVFSLAVLTSSCSYTAQILAYVSLPFLFERVLNMTPVQSGLLITPWPLTTAIAAQLAGRLVVRYPAAVLSSVGLGILAAGLVLMVFLPAEAAYWQIAWRMALCGVGFGLFQTPNNTAMMTTGPASRSGAASGMNAVARFAGWTLGSALVTLLFGLGGERGPALCLAVGATFAAAGALASAARRWREVRAGG
ncbi:MFS transporter [Alloalcanivorax sp. C16-1]|uniref:MFS transporter n=1 Tax=Alloalcanivorax sp. C16-1 TaxID=3390051 RepID=UPI00397086B4